MAANQLSPGVVVQERDLTTITSLSTANLGVIAAPFELGPVEEVVSVTSERDLVEKFGKPNDSNYEYWYTASQFLSYGGILKAIRVNSTSLKNGVDGGTAPLIKNLDGYEASYEDSNNNWKWAARTPGHKGNSIGIFVTDSGADQIAVLPAPGSGNEHEFVADAALSASSGAAGKVYKYSILLSVDTIVGTFTPGATTTINIGGSQESVDVLAWDSNNQKLEIGLPSGGVTGIIADGQTITAGTNTAAIASSGIERRLYIAINKDSIEFAGTDVVADTNSTNVTVTSVRVEYNEREYLPGVKWINVAPRPGTSQSIAGQGGYRDEMHLVVVDVNGGLTGTAGAVLERFVGMSKASDAKTSVGETNYYKTVIKQRSNYIYWGLHETGLFSATGTLSDGNWGLAGASRQFNLLRSSDGTTDFPGGSYTIGSKNNATFYYRLADGANYSVASGEYSVSSTDVESAYQLIADPESQTIDYILTGPSGVDDGTAKAKVTALANIVEERRDCLLFVSPRRANVVGVSSASQQTENIEAFFKLLPSSSYVVFDSGYKYIYDKYNDVYRYVPCAADVAGLCVATTNNAETWFSPAGYNRGQIRNATKLAYSPKQAERDRLYTDRINPIVAFPGQGIVLFGDKTALASPSAFDRINVRRLFVELEKNIANFSKYQLFEINDELTRSGFRSAIEPYLRGVQGRRGIYDFLVVCDTTNNTPDVIDRNELVAEIFIKPARTINYITITFVATRTGVSFNELTN